jgi:hypothetical protein
MGNARCYTCVKRNVPCKIDKYARVLWMAEIRVLLQFLDEIRFDRRVEIRGQCYKDFHKELQPTSFAQSECELVSLGECCCNVKSQLVEALRYKPEGRGFDSRWCQWIFHWHNPVGRTMALESTQPLTEMSTRNISWGVNAARACGWQPTTFVCRLSRNLEASTSWNPYGLSRPVIGLLYLYSHC